MVLDATAADEETHPVVALMQDPTPATPTKRTQGESRRAELAALAGIGGQVVKG